MTERDVDYWSTPAREARAKYEAERRREAQQYHDNAHRGLLDRLTELGIDPDELKSWLEGPRP